MTEGVYTARAVCRIAAERGVEVPICEAVRAIVDDGVSVDEQIDALMSRPFRAEGED